MALTLPKKTEEQLIAVIKHFFSEHMDEEIGDLRASLFLDLCLKQVGPVIYNQAIADAQAFMQNKVTDMGISCYEPEEDYLHD